jgi:hypothetical protein
MIVADRLVVTDVAGGRLGLSGNGAMPSGVGMDRSFGRSVLSLHYF